VFQGEKNLKPCSDQGLNKTEKAQLFPVLQQHSMKVHALILVTWVDPNSFRMSDSRISHSFGLGKTEGKRGNSDTNPQKQFRCKLFPL